MYQFFHIITETFLSLKLLPCFFLVMFLGSNHAAVWEKEVREQKINKLPIWSVCRVRKASISTFAKGLVVQNECVLDYEQARMFTCFYFSQFFWACKLLFLFIVHFQVSLEINFSPWLIQQFIFFYNLSVLISQHKAYRQGNFTK